MHSNIQTPMYKTEIVLTSYMNEHIYRRTKLRICISDYQPPLIQTIGHQDPEVDLMHGQRPYYKILKLYQKNR